MSEHDPHNCPECQTVPIPLVSDGVCPWCLLLHGWLPLRAVNEGVRSACACCGAGAYQHYIPCPPEGTPIVYHEGNRESIPLEEARTMLPKFYPKPDEDSVSGR
jgi:hypothetical protein